MPQQFFDHFALANLSLQERLGRSASALNRDSAVFGQQTRSLLQMLNYGLDAITARAASHLMNMDVLHSNDSYLLKLSEGLLLNSVKSITPPKINTSTPFKFWSEKTYSLWSSIGTISLKDGSKTNLIAFDIDVIGVVEGSELGREYSVLYCAGDYVQQSITSVFDGYSPGTFAPIYISETYKSIWSDSVEVKLVMDGEVMPRDIALAWSLDELLSMPDTSDVVLIQHTPRGMTLTLGDGEIFGKGYNNNGSVSKISQVIVTYVKCNSVSPVDHASIKFNSDITEIYTAGGVPLLSQIDMGDTPNDLRSRSIAEFFAASKITSENDLVTEVLKIPFVKSCFARREYNWPLFNTASKLLAGYEDYRHNKVDTPNRKFYNSYKYNGNNTYSVGDMVVREKTLYICKVQSTSSSPANTKDWVKFLDLDAADAINAIYANNYPSACIYDNATIVLSGLVMKNRRYWTPYVSYSSGDVVYHSGTKKLWLALRDGGNLVEPGSETDLSIYDTDRYWVTREEAITLEGENSPLKETYSDSILKFDDYEPMTQAMFEAEIKGYFGISRKLGFTSVVVEPLSTIGVHVTVTYSTVSTVKQYIRKIIEDYICYNVGKVLEADTLNALLTSEYNMSAVYVTITLMADTPVSGISVSIPSATYVPPSMLDIELNERLGVK